LRLRAFNVLLGATCDRAFRPALLPHPAVTQATRECRKNFLSVTLFSGVVNLLMLAGPLCMLQVYDRVLASQSVPTLIALSILLPGTHGS
jgi:ABC-type protease/lipase transport system fused ATPase/permease subunit